MACLVPAAAVTTTALVVGGGDMTAERHQQASELDEVGGVNRAGERASLDVDDENEEPD